MIFLLFIDVSLQRIGRLDNSSAGGTRQEPVYHLFPREVLSSCCLRYLTHRLHKTFKTIFCSSCLQWFPETRLIQLSVCSFITPSITVTTSISVTLSCHIFSTAVSRPLYVLIPSYFLSDRYHLYHKTHNIDNITGIFRNDNVNENCYFYEDKTYKNPMLELYKHISRQVLKLKQSVFTFFLMYIRYLPCLLSLGSFYRLTLLERRIFFFRSLLSLIDNVKRDLSPSVFSPWSHFLTIV